MTERIAALEKLAGHWELDGLELAGRGLEFATYRAQGRGGASFALRVAHRRFDSNANDPGVDTRALLTQEYEISRYLTGLGLPVAEPVELFLAQDAAFPDVLLSRYVPDDGSDLDCLALGRLLARLHLLPPPPIRPVASEGMPTSQVIAARIRRRWAEVGRYIDDWPEPPDPAVLLRHLAAVRQDSLVHLDVRSDNIRRENGRITALLDWSNAVLGDSTVEFGRLAEYARYPENQLDMEALTRGYESVRTPPAPSGALLACRLDAAVMLALVFLSEAPDPGRGTVAADHARELGARVTAVH